MFDLVPFAGPWREMGDRNGDTDLIRQALQFQLPQAEPPAVAASTVRRDQDPARAGRESSAFVPPPAANRRDRERTRVVIGPDIDDPGVAPDVVDAIRIRSRHVGRRKIMRAHRPGLLCGTPWLAGIGQVADELFLLRIDRDHRTSLAEASFHRGVDVPKLRVAVRMVAPLFRFPVALEAVLEAVQELRDRRVAALVGASRIEKGKHYLSDVLFGATLGYIAGRTAVRSTERSRVPGRLTFHPMIGFGRSGLIAELRF